MADNSGLDVAVNTDALVAITKGRITPHMIVCY